MSCLDLVDAGLMLRELDSRTPEERVFYARARAIHRAPNPSPAPQSPRARGAGGEAR